MKSIIDIPEDIYTSIKNGMRYKEDVEYVMDKIEQCTPIPENATNGDVLKRLLYGKAIITEFIHDVNISVNNNVIGQLDMEWWNSPYKRGETE